MMIIGRDDDYRERDNDDDREREMMIEREG